MNAISAKDILLHPQSGDSSDIKEAIECAKKALEKQIPKKLRIDNDDWLCCPNCDDTFKMFDSFGKRNRHCGNCGQALDWSDKNG